MHRVLCRHLWLLLLAACASAPPPAPQHDPLPEMFPLQVQLPATTPGFELLTDQLSTDPYVGRTLLYRSLDGSEHTIEVQVFLDGAFVDDLQALDSIGANALQRELHELETAGAEPQLSRRRQQVSLADGGERHGRSIRIEATERVRLLSIWFADPFAVVLRIDGPLADAERLTTLLGGFSERWVAQLQVDQALLCDARVQVVPVYAGLSKVSSNGRIIFFSVPTDNHDEDTMAELLRLSASQRERLGCPADGVDYSAVLERMRRRSKSH